MASAPPSETDSLLGGRRTPPPRYSSIWTEERPEPKQTAQSDVPSVHARGQVSQPPGHSTGQQTGQQSGYESQRQFPGPGNPQVQPGWWPWVPGPGQYFPPGLEHMSHVSELTVSKHGNKFLVFRHETEQIYVVRVNRPRCCAGGSEAVSIRVQNNAHLDVLNLTRTEEESSCCTFTLTHLEVSFPPGNMVGVVQGTAVEYSVHNPSGDMLFLLEKQGDGCCKKGGYEIFSPERIPFGKIYLQKTTCCSTEMKVTFPLNFDLRLKGLLLAAALSVRDLHWD